MSQSTLWSVAVGDVVIYRQPGAAAPWNGTREHPAIVTRVHGAACVNLMVLYDGLFGGAKPLMSIDRARAGLDGFSAWRTRDESWPAAPAVEAETSAPQGVDAPDTNIPQPEGASGAAQDTAAPAAEMAQ